MLSVSLTNDIKRLALQSGFDSVGITSADGFENTKKVILERIEQGLLDGIPWFTKPGRVEIACDPAQTLGTAKSIISLAVNYFAEEPTPPSQDGVLRGRVSRYAWGDDYHEAIKGRLRHFAQSLTNVGASPEEMRLFVDTGPMIDRAAAQRAGVGWYGKSTNMLLPKMGSWFFLAQVITSLELEPDKPLKKTCGACQSCINSCPTGAITAPYVVDNSLCISYLTIECRGSIPRKLRPLMGDWVFGCDLCQDTCPVNRHAPKTNDPAFQPRSYDHYRPDLVEILDMEEEAFRQRFKNSPIRRAKLTGLKRNACVALGNLGDPKAVDALTKALGAPEALVRGHAAWALGKIASQDAQTVLHKALSQEKDAEVLEEILLALDPIAETQTSVEQQSSFKPGKQAKK